MSNLINIFIPNLKRQTTINISSFRSFDRRVISSIQSPPTNPNKTVYGRMELDSHADTIVAGSNCCVLHYMGRVCDVSPYIADYEPVKGVPIVCAATAWQSPNTGQVYILGFNEALYMPNLNHSLLNPNQLRHHGTVVQDNPVSSAPIHIRTEDASFSMPLEMAGCTIFADTFTPTPKILNTSPRIILSSPHEWDPGNVIFPQTTRTLEEEIDSIRSGATVSAVKRAEYINPQAYGDDGFEDEYTHCCSCGSSFCKCTHKPFVLANISSMSSRLIKSLTSKFSRNRRVKEVDTSAKAKPPLTFHSKNRHSDVTPEDLSERWFISPAQAAMTLKKTTQKFMRSALLPLSRRYRADRMFYRKTLSGHWSTDTMDGKTKSINGN